MDEDWEAWTTQELRDLRVCYGRSQREFARRVGVDRRTVQRWETGETRPTDKRLVARLDSLAGQLIAKRASWLLDPQGGLLMNRRDALRLLAGGAVTSVPGVAAVPPRALRDAQLDDVEATTTALASTYHNVAPRALLAPVTAHLDEASRLLRGSMLPGQRDRLRSLTADLAVFVAYLLIHGDRFGQADAYLELAASRAAEAGDRARLAEISCAQGHLSLTTVNGQQGDPKTAVGLMERAAKLAIDAPAFVRSQITAKLAEARATAEDGYASDEALQGALRALDDRSGPPLPGAGFCSTSGFYARWHAGRVEGFRGTCDVLLGRPERAVPTLRATLELPLAPRQRAIHLTDLGAACASGRAPEPDQAAAWLIEAHELNEASGYTLGYRRVLGACERLKGVDTPAVRGLFERLHLPPRSGAWA